MTKNELKYYQKLKQKKYRDQENQFLIEGVHLIEECLHSEYYKSNLLRVFLRNDFIGKDEILEDITKANSRAEIIYTDSKSIDALSETVNAQGIVGLVSKRETKFTEDFKEDNIIIALDSINDPGNLGTILRTGYWFGIKKVLLSAGSVEIFNSKVIRSSQGAIFNLDIYEEVNLADELLRLNKENFNIVLSDVKTENILSDLKITKTGKFVLVFGNESEGISKSILDNENYQKVKIKGHSDCESLNVSVSAGIIMDHFKN